MRKHRVQLNKEGVGKNDLFVQLNLLNAYLCMMYLMVYSYRKGEGMVEAEFLVVMCELHEETCALFAVVQQS